MQIDSLLLLVGSLPDSLKMVARSVLYPTVSALELGDLQVRMPATSEQRAIADYLDTETARIDALITKKRRLIDLLNERRLACVSHNLAVWLPGAPTETNC